jgi:hypothetical protein
MTPLKPGILFTIHSWKNTPKCKSLLKNLSISCQGSRNTSQIASTGKITTKMVKRWNLLEMITLAKLHKFIIKIFRTVFSDS